METSLKAFDDIKGPERVKCFAGFRKQPDPIGV